MAAKPLIVASAGPVIPPLLRLSGKITVLPLVPEAWAGRQEQIEILSVQAPPETGLYETLVQCAAVLEILPDTPDRKPFLLQYFHAARAVNGFLEVLEALHRERGVRGVVVHNDVEPVYRAVCEWANAHDVPAIHVPHSHYFLLWRDEPGWDVHDVVTAPYIACINEAQRRYYREAGRGAVRRLEVCGCPLWDQWATFPVGVARARALLGLDPTQPIVTYLASWPQTTSLLGPPPVHAYQVFEAFCLAVRALGWQLILKLHPRGEEAIGRTHWEIQNRVGVKGIATPDHLGYCLQAADVVASYGVSNGLIEAAAGFGKPVLAVSGTAPPIPGAPGDPDAIALELSRLKDTAPPPQVVELAPHLGEATQRVAQFIEEVLELGEVQEA